MWRLALFALLLAAFGLVIGALLAPPGIQGMSAALLGGSVAAGWAVLALDDRSPGALGFHVGPTAPLEVGGGLAVGSGVALLAVAAMAAAGAVWWSGEPGTVGGYLGGTAAALAWFFLPAAAEEALFRGYPLQALAESWGRGTALLATSAAFGLAHVGNPGADWIGAFNTGAAGLFLGGLYLRTESLWWPTGAHVGWNWAHGWIADVPVSGMETMDAPWVEAHLRGPEWLSGGAFGPEGSVLTTAVALGAAAWVWKTPRLGPGPGTEEVEPLAPAPKAGRTRSGTEVERTSNRTSMRHER